ncbi:hypothetical protein B0H14DRAFT_2571458 [Mycena olivaceomarginata]|nr:hypothetical protein B0H14DRAFT_2571458 [Mycena olivaceomarginata]
MADANFGSALATTKSARINREQYDMLCELTRDFLDPTQEIGQIEIGDTLSDVFGDYLQKPTAQATLQVYELAVRKEGKMHGNPPKIPAFTDAASSGAARSKDNDVEMHSKEKKDLGRSFDKLMASAFIEREAVNSSGAVLTTPNVCGNKHGKGKKDLGRSFDELMASVFIERKVVNSTGAVKPIYYCLGCENPGSAALVPMIRMPWSSSFGESIGLLHPLHCDVVGSSSEHRKSIQTHYPNVGLRIGKLATSEAYTLLRPSQARQTSPSRALLPFALSLEELELGPITNDIARIPESHLATVFTMVLKAGLKGFCPDVDGPVQSKQLSETRFQTATRLQLRKPVLRMAYIRESHSDDENSHGRHDFRRPEDRVRDDPLLPASEIGLVLPPDVPVDFFTPEFFNSLTVKERARYADTGVPFPLAEYTFTPVHEGWKKMGKVEFMKAYGKEVLQWYEIPTAEEIAALPNSDADDELDGEEEIDLADTDYSEMEVDEECLFLL